MVQRDVFAYKMLSNYSFAYLRKRNPNVTSIAIPKRHVYNDTKASLIYVQMKYKQDKHCCRRSKVVLARHESLKVQIYFSISSSNPNSPTSFLYAVYL
jgi:hypothetical protein